MVHLKYERTDANEKLFRDNVLLARPVRVRLLFSPARSWSSSQLNIIPVPDDLQAGSPPGRPTDRPTDRPSPIRVCGLWNFEREEFKVTFSCSRGASERASERACVRASRPAGRPLSVLSACQKMWAIWSADKRTSDDDDDEFSVEMQRGNCSLSVG